jgi:hypothetical protein
MIGHAIIMSAVAIVVCTGSRDLGARSTTR